MNMSIKLPNSLIAYQTKKGAIGLRGDFRHETVWATQAQIVDMFDIDQSVVSRHIRGIFNDGEMKMKSNMQKMHIAGSDKPTTLYSLDVILAVGYRTNSAKATSFRQWATKVLHQHITDGYTINKKRLANNYDTFLKAVEDVKRVLPAGGAMDAGSAVELVKMFAETWLSLSAYDKAELPKSGSIKKRVKMTASDLSAALSDLKKTLATEGNNIELFGKERAADSVAGIVGNVFQAFGGQEVYPTVEEKAAHLLYFMVKNHPFVDGNKRSGAFSFVWFLKRAGALDIARMSPEALTALTLLVAESNPKDKGRVVGLILAMI